MMMKLQEELLRKTQAVERGVRGDRGDLSEQEKRILRRLSDEQGKLGDLLRRFLEKFERMREPEGRPAPRRGPGEE